MKERDHRMKHTPEPWHVHTHPGHKEDPCQVGNVATQTADVWGWSLEEREANAYHIVACVNALAGLNPEGVRACVEALEKLVLRCDGDEGIRADGSNIDTTAAHAALDQVNQ